MILRRRLLASGFLLLTADSPASNTGVGYRTINGTPLRAPVRDIDGDTRSATRPDIGADER